MQIAPMVASNSPTVFKTHSAVIVPSRSHAISAPCSQFPRIRPSETGQRISILAGRACKVVAYSSRRRFRLLLGTLRSGHRPGASRVRGTYPMAAQIQFPPVGSKWQERDLRVKRTVQVVRHDIENRRVRIYCAQTEQLSWAKPERFNGKSGGYVQLTTR
jgi:hypothetical protein